jgi:hypothetical protein
MKNTERRKAVVMAAMGLGFSVIIGANYSYAIDRSPARSTPAIRIQTGAITNNAGRVSLQVGVQQNSFRSSHHDVGTARSTLSVTHKVQGSSVSNLSALNLNEITIGRNRTLPGPLPGLDRIPDPSDIMKGWGDTRNVPGKDMINSRYLGGPDKEYNAARDGSYLDYKTRNSNSDISNADCMWNEGTWNKVTHWGGNGSPLIGDTTTGNNFRCNPDERYDTNNGSGNKGTGGKQNSDKSTGTKEIKAESKVVKEVSGKPGDKGSKGTEGDDPDEFKSPVTQNSLKRVEMLDLPLLSDVMSWTANTGSGNRSGNGNGLTRSGTNTPRGLPSTHVHKIGPNHENRPDTSGSPTSSFAAINRLSYAASPTPDGGNNPPPGPEFSPLTLANSTANSTLRSRQGYASSPAIDGEGGSVGPTGPEF